MSVFTDIQFNVKIEQITFCNYQLMIDDKIMKLTFPQLLQLRNKIFEITLPSNLEQIIQNENYVLLFIADKKHLVFLEIPKLLDLQQEISLCFNNY